MGPYLLELSRKPAARFGAKSVSGAVANVDSTTRPFRLDVGKETYEAEALIVSTGASARLLGLESEQKLMGHGVSACATCDGFFFKDKRLIVVGGGDTAMEEALFLTKFATEVHVVHRRHELRASKIMVERAQRNEKISFVWNSIVEDIIGEAKGGGVTAVRLRDVKTDEVRDFPCDGVFIAIGHSPNTKLFEGQLELDANGYIVTKPKSTYTGIEGVFACGDVQDHVYRQAVTAAGTGCMASIDAERWLDAQGSG
jgi:thioredoxin reductase (NADPH)